MTNNVSATFQLRGLFIVCEFRYGPFVNPITWAQRPSIKMQFRSHQFEYSLLKSEHRTAKDRRNVSVVGSPINFVQVMITVFGLSKKLSLLLLLVMFC